MNNEKIFFSIILPTFNRGNKISKAIDSVINQSYKNWELIVIDNNSSDHTEKIVSSYNMDKISFYKYNNDGIIAKSRNYGIHKSKGEYICFLDSDDWWDEFKLFYVYKEVIKDSLFIYHDHFVLNDSRIIKKRKITGRNMKNPIFGDLLNYGPCFATSAVTIHKNSFYKIGCFEEDKDFYGWEDLNAWLTFAEFSNKFSRINKPLSTILIHGENALNDNLKISNMNKFCAKYLNDRKFIPNWCLYNQIIAHYNIADFLYVKLNIKKINFLSLNNIQKINYIKIFLNTLFK